MEFDVLTFVIGCVLGAIVGWRACDRFHQSMLSEILKAAGIGEAELKRALENLRVELPEDHEDALPKVEVRIEEVNGSLYAYRVDTDEFLGQGADATALIERITEINKTNFILVVSQENGSDLMKPAKS
jgi:hypothetical protein